MSISLALSLGSAIPNLDTLRSLIAQYLDRDDLADMIPVFIALAESEFNRELRTPEMETTVTFSASAEDTIIPVADFLAMRAIYREGSPDRPLTAVPPTAIRDGYDGTTGTPQSYCLVSGGIRLVPPPADAILLTMDYWAQIPALSTSVPSNWLLEKHPTAYLYGALFQAEAYMDNAVRASQWRSLFEEIMGRIVKNARNDRFGAGALVPHIVTQVRSGRA